MATWSPFVTPLSLLKENISIQTGCGAQLQQTKHPAYNLTCGYHGEVDGDMVALRDTPLLEHVRELLHLPRVQGYLARKKQPPP